MSATPSRLTSPVVTTFGLEPTPKSTFGAKQAGAVSHQHRHVLRRLVGDSEVGDTVAVEVAHPDRAWQRADCLHRSLRERSRPISAQHGDLVAVAHGGGEVGVAVTVEVAGRYRRRARGERDRRSGEAPRRRRAAPRRRRWRSPRRLRGRGRRRRRHRLTASPRGAPSPHWRCWYREAARPVSEPHDYGEVAASGRGDREIRIAVGVEVVRDDSDGAQVGRDADRGRVPAGDAAQHGQVQRAAVRRHEVRPAVAVKSSATIAVGPLPTGWVVAAPNPPLPLPSSTFAADAAGHDREVEVTVEVEISERDRVRAAAGGREVGAREVDRRERRWRERRAGKARRRQRQARGPRSVHGVPPVVTAAARRMRRSSEGRRTNRYQSPNERARQRCLCGAGELRWFEGAVVKEDAGLDVAELGAGLEAEIVHEP